MNVSYLQHSKCTFSPIRPPTLSPQSLIPRVSISIRRNTRNANSFPRKNTFLASSSDTLVAEVVSKQEDEFEDLKSWMHNNGLPPCKVVLKERHSHDPKHQPIHYVAASEDLQVLLIWDCIECSCFFFITYITLLANLCLSSLFSILCRLGIPCFLFRIRW